MVSEQKLRAINFVEKLKALARTLFLPLLLLLGHLPPSPRRGHEVTQILGHFTFGG